MKAILAFIITLFLSVSYGQDSPNYYVQFKVQLVGSEKDATSIDKKMANKKGIISSQTDHVTSTYFCTMTGDAEYVFEDFEVWFEKMGFKIMCFNKGIQGDGNLMSPHVLKNCEDLNK